MLVSVGGLLMFSYRGHIASIVVSVVPRGDATGATGLQELGGGVHLGLAATVVVSGLLLDRLRDLLQAVRHVAIFGAIVKVRTYIPRRYYAHSLLLSACCLDLIASTLPHQF